MTIMTGEHYDVLIASISNRELVTGLFVSHYGELAEEHLVGAQATVLPGVEINQNALAYDKLRVTINNAQTVSDLPAQLFDYDLAFGYFSLEYFLDLQLYVSEYASLPLIEAAFY